MTKGMVIFLLLFTLVACTPWAKRGYNGVAELSATPFLPYYPTLPEVTPRQILQTRILAARTHLDNLLVKGASACFPGLWHIVQLQSNRTVREFAGGLYDDAYLDSVILENQVNMLQRYVRHVRNRVTCQPGYRKPYQLFANKKKLSG